MRLLHARPLTDALMPRGQVRQLRPPRRDTDWSCPEVQHTEQRGIGDRGLRHGTEHVSEMISSKFCHQNAFAPEHTLALALLAVSHG